jgi:SAM-dependent methyltransferase
LNKVDSTKQNEYVKPSHALAYLAKADHIPHRAEGEAIVLELLPPQVRRILDLGCGDGRLLALAKLAKPQAYGVALDFSPTMLTAARARFAQDPTVSVIEHNLNEPLPNMGVFDVILSSFAIHHLNDNRKYALYQEIHALLEPEGVFCNLEHVASPTLKLHEDFYRALGSSVAEEDPSNQCVVMEVQLTGFAKLDLSVDCFEVAGIGLAGWVKQDAVSK